VRRKRTVTKRRARPACPGFEWAEGSTIHIRRMLAGQGNARLDAILATAPQLRARYISEIDKLLLLKIFKDHKQPKYKRAYRDVELEARRAEQFVRGICGAVIKGISEPWALELEAVKRVKQFDRSRRSSSPEQEASPQEEKILDHAAQLIRNRKVHDYPSLRRELGSHYKGTDVFPSAITKALARHAADRFGQQFAPK
jgi:hypothetical protein